MLSVLLILLPITSASVLLLLGGWMGMFYWFLLLASKLTGLLFCLITLSNNEAEFDMLRLKGLVIVLYLCGAK